MDLDFDTFLGPIRVLETVCRFKPALGFLDKENYIFYGREIVLQIPSTDRTYNGF